MGRLAQDNTLSTAESQPACKHSVWEYSRGKIQRCHRTFPKEIAASGLFPHKASLPLKPQCPSPNNIRHIIPNWSRRLLLERLCPKVKLQFLLTSDTSENVLIDPPTLTSTVIPHSLLASREEVIPASCHVSNLTLTSLTVETNDPNRVPQLQTTGILGEPPATCAALYSKVPGRALASPRRARTNTPGALAHTAGDRVSCPGTAAHLQISTSHPPGPYTRTPSLFQPPHHTRVDALPGGARGETWRWGRPRTGNWKAGSNMHGLGIPRVYASAIGEGAKRRPRLKKRGLGEGSLTQGFDSDLPGERRRQVDAHQVYILVQ